MHYLVVFFIVCILVSEGNATYLRNDVWHTEETLHRDNLLKAPDNIRPRISLASYYIKKREFSEAISLLRGGEDIVNSGVVRVQKNWIGLLYHNLGATYYQMSELDEAKANLLKSVEYEQFSWQTHLLLGMVFFMEGNIDQSVKAYANAVSLHPSDPKSFNMFGRALYASGDHNLALNAFYKGLELAQQDKNQYEVIKTIHFNIIACYLAQEDFVNAKRTLRMVEKDYDYIVYKYTLYSEYYKQSLQEIAVYNDIIYLIYKAILYPEYYDESMQKIAVRLASADKEYCDLLEEVEENRYLGIIYPSIDDFEYDLSKLYDNELDKLIENLEYKKTSSSDCSSIDDKVVSD